MRTRPFHLPKTLGLGAALLAFALGVAAPWALPVEAQATEGQTIAILHSNDVHCSGLATSANAIGYAGIAQAATAAEAAYGEGHVTLVDAGDAIQGQPIGTLSQGSDLVDLMNAASYDVAAVGNHEFDYGIPRLQELASTASYPYVACNVVNTESGQALFEPYKLIDYAFGDDTVSVAYVGITTPTTLTSESPSIFANAAGETVWSFYGDESGEALYDQVQKSVDAARAAGADYVIAVAHLGKDATSSVPERWTSTAVVANTTGIDGVIDGHTHLVYNVKLTNADGEQIPVAQCGMQFQAYGTMTITPDDTPGPEDVQSSVTVAADQAEPVAQDATVAEAVQAKEDALAGELQREVGTTEASLSFYAPNSEDTPYYWVARMGESNVGDFVADAYRSYLDADVAFVNGGGIRGSNTWVTPLPNGTFGFAPGAIAYQDLISINSFGNPVSLVEVSGQDLLDALEYSVRALTPALDDATEATGSFLQVSGLTFKASVDIPSPVVENAAGGFDHVIAGMQRRVSDVFVGGEPIDPAGTYTLASIPIILSGSGDYTMFGDASYLVRDAGTDYDILASYLADDLGGVIGQDAYGDPAGAGRIEIMTSGTPAGPTVGVTRLYNYDTGEHLFTADANEVQTLKGLGWLDEGVRFAEYREPSEEDWNEYVPVFRLYHYTNGDHLYTTNQHEAYVLTSSGEWVSDGAGWWAPKESSIPVYRLYNPAQTANEGFGSHLWTTEANEKNVLVTRDRWDYEGIAWYAVDDSQI